MRCEAQIARFWLLRRRVSQSLRAHSQTRKHWGRECILAGKCGSRRQSTASFSENVVAAKSSYPKMLEILSLSDRERT